jgi:hypothetical protein
MKKNSSQSAFLNLPVLISLVAILAGVFLALFATSAEINRRKPAIKRVAPSGVQQEWVALYNGGYGPDIADAIAIDGSGNVYVTGLSVGPGTCNLACVDYATIKYDPSGTQLMTTKLVPSSLMAEEMYT